MLAVCGSGLGRSPPELVAGRAEHQEQTGEENPLLSAAIDRARARLRERGHRRHLIDAADVVAAVVIAVGILARTTVAGAITAHFDLFAVTRAIAIDDAGLRA